MIALKAHYDGKVIVPDEPVDLPKGQKLRIRIQVIAADGVGKRRTGKGKGRQKKEESLLEWAKENAVADDPLPPDLGHQHDHYLYGTPKKPPAGS